MLVCCPQNLLWKERERGESPATSACPCFPLWPVLISFTLSVIYTCVFSAYELRLVFWTTSCWWIAQQRMVLKDRRRDEEIEGKRWCLFVCFFSIQVVIGALLLPLLHLALLPVHSGIEISQRWESSSICRAYTHTHRQTLRNTGSGTSRRSLIWTSTQQTNTSAPHAGESSHTSHHNAITTVI